MADTNYDVIVLGSGPGGYVAAIRCAQLGLKTAIVERELLGGICLNWGCIPTKALLRSAEIFHYMQHAGDYGLVAKGIEADLAAVVKRSRGVAKQLNQGVTHLMKKNKIAVHMGEGAITAPGKMTVTADGKKTDLAAKQFALHDRGLEAQLRAADRGDIAAGAGAENDDVVLVCHGSSCQFLHSAGAFALARWTRRNDSTSACAMCAAPL